MIAEFLSQFISSTSRSYFLLKYTEQKTGFMVHLAMAYPLIGDELVEAREGSRFLEAIKEGL